MAFKLLGTFLQGIKSIENQPYNILNRKRNGAHEWKVFTAERVLGVTGISFGGRLFNNDNESFHFALTERGFYILCYH